MQGLLTIFALVEPGRASSYQLACKTAHAWAGKRFGWDVEPDPSDLNRARNRVTEAECMGLLTAATSMAHGHLRRIPLAWALGSHTVGERDTLLGLLNQLAKNALLILDRGYPSDVVFGRILASGRHCVARMVASDGAAWQEVRDFLPAASTMPWFRLKSAADRLDASFTCA